jgi:hypothetical protein
MCLMLTGFDSSNSMATNLPFFAVSSYRTGGTIEAGNNPAPPRIV